MEFKNLLIEKQDRICIVKINRPQALNALNGETYKEIYNCFKQLSSDELVDIIILTGEGRAFVAGADISFMKDMTPIEAKEFGVYGTEAFDMVENIDKVVIASINGYALGGGCELALACDLRIASKKAKFGQPEVSLGITPGSGGTQRLSRVVGVSKAKELIYTGDIIDAEEALRIGLINRVVDEDRLTEEVLNLAKRINSNARIAVKYSKEAIDKGIQADIKTGMSIENNLFGLCFSTLDQKEGMSAFLEKRKAKFGGR